MRCGNPGHPMSASAGGVPRDDSADYASLFLSAVPLLDVRAPVEFAKGAFPHALNLPLMDDAERHQVGLRFKQGGQAEAIALGERLVSGSLRAQRLAGWAQFAQAHPDGYLYCFRGGLRSGYVQRWLREAGIHYPRVRGGYKAMRGFLLQTLDEAWTGCDFVVLGGMTGTGKTELLAPLAHGLDLEHHARHRGSSFGRRLAPQPAQVDFDNALAIDLLRKRHDGLRRFVVEDEGQAIGACSLPFALYQLMQRRPMIWLEDTLENRVARILRDYVIEARAEAEQALGAEAGHALYAARLRQGLDGIRKRLGGLRHRDLGALLDAALAAEQRGEGTERHRDWIGALLTGYYDPMYAYQRQQKQARIVFAGPPDAVRDYLRADASRARD